jgi:NSS family neurotransmitter:Na+ symporter
MPRLQGILNQVLISCSMPDFTKINGEVVLTAIGQAFFSIGVAMGLMMTYGAYLSDDTSLTRSALVIAGTDTLIALLAD